MWGCLFFVGVAGAVAAAVIAGRRQGRFSSCGRFLVFYTETTDLPNFDAPNAGNVDMWPYVTQLAWIAVERDGRELVRGCYDMAQGDDIHVALTVFRAVMEGCDCIVGHNVAFGVNMLQAECLRTGVCIDWNSKLRLCTMRESTDYCAIPHAAYIYKWPKLAELYTKLFDDRLATDSDAMRNAEAVARCLVELLARGVVR